MNYFCMYQQIGNTKIIFGIGKNEVQAIKDAKQYAEHLDGLILAKCTKELYDYVYAGESGRNIIRNGAGLIDVEESFIQ